MYPLYKELCLPIHECTRAAFTLVLKQSLMFPGRHWPALFVRLTWTLWGCAWVWCVLNWGTGSLSSLLYLFHGIFRSSNVLSGFPRPVYTSSLLKVQPLIHSGVQRVAQIKFPWKFAYEFLSLWQTYYQPSWSKRDFVCGVTFEMPRLIKLQPSQMAAVDSCTDAHCH